MNWYKIGGLIWTGCAASWLVLGITFDIPSAFVVGLGCIAAACAFNWMGRS